jgi:hypothetical protein
MIRFIFLFLLLSISVYFVVLKPDVDGFSISLVGIVFYFFPILLGRGVGVEGSYSIHFFTYIFACVIIIFLFFAERLIPRYCLEFKGGNVDKTGAEVRILTMITLLVAAIFFIDVNYEILGAAKININSTIPAKLLRYLLPISLIAGWIHRDWKYMIPLALALIMYTVLYQVRTPVAVTAVGVFLSHASETEMKFKKRIKIGFIGSITGVSILLFDKTKGYLLEGDIGILFKTTRNLNQIFYNNNGHVIFQILYCTLRKQYRLSNPVEHFSINFLSVVPLEETILGIPSMKFSNIVREALFPGREAGIASNIWAEAYALGGLIGVGVALSIFVIGISFLSSQLDSRTWCVKLFAISILPYWTLLSHRLTLGAILSTTSITAIVCFTPAVIAGVSRWFSAYKYTPLTSIFS